VSSQRRMMDESLGAIVALLAGEETVTMKTDWFELREARLQLLPFSRPCFPIAVASTFSPAGMITAGKYGAGVLSIGVGALDGGSKIRQQWALAEEAAAGAGTIMQRQDWRLVQSFHLAETREQAFREIEQGQRFEAVNYWRGTLGQPPRPQSPEELIKAGGAIVGTPDDAIDAIEELQKQSGGFGCMLALAHEWANREATLRSFELFARYVMPRFQQALPSIEESNRWVAGNRYTILSPAGTAIAKAFTDAGKEVPPELAERLAKIQQTART